MSDPKKLVAGGVVAGLALSGTVALASHSFTDVPDTHPFHDDIGWMDYTGISNGFPDGTYRPSEPVTRQAMSAFMRRLAGADPAVDPMVDADTVDGLHSDELLTTVYSEGAPGVGDGTGASEPFAVAGLELPAGTYQFTLGLSARTFVALPGAGGSGAASEPYEYTCVVDGLDPSEPRLDGIAPLTNWRSASRTFTASIDSDTQLDLTCGTFRGTPGDGEFTSFAYEGVVFEALQVDVHVDQSIEK